MKKIQMYYKFKYWFGMMLINSESYRMTGRKASHMNENNILFHEMYVKVLPRCWVGGIK